LVYKNTTSKIQSFENTTKGEEIFFLKKRCRYVDSL